MLTNFLQYIQEHNLFQSNDKILLGISGGLDSVVMMDLFHRAKLQFAIAHCNFHLRGSESDKDEEFVGQLAQRYKVAFYHTHFNTKEYANENGISIEMAARDLRYKWFDKILKENGYTRIAVAHHADDSRETFLLNLVRGTGIRGLRGIQPKVGNVVRPLLFANRKDLFQHSIDRDLEFREDLSNADTIYQRNKIRHEVLPLLEEMNPSFRQSLTNTMERLYEADMMLSSLVEEQRHLIAKEQDGRIYMDIKKLSSLTPRQTWLFELLRPYNFNSDVVREISAALKGSSGKQFYSTTHRLIRDRESLIISPLAEKVEEHRYYIEKGTASVDIPCNLELSVEEMGAEFEIPRDSSIACLDLDKITYPLMIRKWQQGDFFRPLGMKGMKKVSDYFIDRKFSIPQKESTWLLTCGDKIVWIIGHRLDDRFKVNPDSKSALLIKLKSP